MYHLPLLPGYDPGVNVRSSAPPTTKAGQSFLSRLEEAEETGYQGTYFNYTASEPNPDGYISSSPFLHRRISSPPRSPEDENPLGAGTSRPAESSTEALLGPSSLNAGFTSDGGISGTETETEQELRRKEVERRAAAAVEPSSTFETIAEVIFFEYGVIVFFGLDQLQEKSIIEDLDGAKIMMRKMAEHNWEIEECHYEVGYFMSIQCSALITWLFSMILISPNLAFTTTFSVCVYPEPSP
jgi:uncharacterized Rmd1/YagE family protein